MPLVGRAWSKEDLVSLDVEVFSQDEGLVRRRGYRIKSRTTAG